MSKRNNMLKRWIKVKYNCCMKCFHRHYENLFGCGYIFFIFVSYIFILLLFVSCSSYSIFLNKTWMQLVTLKKTKEEKEVNVCPVTLNWLTNVKQFTIIFIVIVMHHWFEHCAFHSLWFPFYSFLVLFFFVLIKSNYLFT